jgi:hypothetical protein
VSDGPGADSYRDDRDQRASAGRADAFERLADWLEATAKACELGWQTPDDYPASPYALRHLARQIRERIRCSETAHGAAAQDAT